MSDKICKKESLFTKEKGVGRMAVLAVPNESIPVVTAEKAKAFIAELNQNKVTEKFLEECKKAGEIFEWEK